MDVYHYHVDGDAVVDATNCFPCYVRYKVDNWVNYTIKIAMGSQTDGNIWKIHQCFWCNKEKCVTGLLVCKEMNLFILLCDYVAKRRCWYNRYINMWWYTCWLCFAQTKVHSNIKFFIQICIIIVNNFLVNIVLVWSSINHRRRSGCFTWLFCYKCMCSEKKSDNQRYAQPASTKCALEYNL